MRVLRIVSLLVVTLIPACGGGSSGSPAAPAPAAATLSSATIVGATTTLTAVGQTSQIAVTGTFSDNSTKDITSQCTFVSSNPAVATVSASGLINAVANGTTTITVTATALGRYGTGETTVAIPSVLYAISGVVILSGSTTPIAGATVTILDGIDANRQETTNSIGYYSITALKAGTFTLRVTKSGYETIDRLVSCTGDTKADFSMKSTAPTPPPPPPTCCKICTTGKPCGDTCIAVTSTCHVGPGCACAG